MLTPRSLAISGIIPAIWSSLMTTTRMVNMSRYNCLGIACSLSVFYSTKYGQACALIQFMWSVRLSSAR